MPVEGVLGVNDSDETLVERPNLEETGKALRESPGIRSVALTGLFILAVFYTLYFAREFFVPVTLAVVFNFLLSPFVRALKKLRIPEAAGAAIVMIAGFGVVAAVIYEFSTPVTQWVARAPEITGRIGAGLQKLRKPVEKVTQATEQVSNMTNPGNQGQKTQQVEIKGPGIVDGLFTKTRDVVFGLSVLLVLLYFLLSSGDLFLRKLVRVLPTFSDQKRAVLIMRQIEDHISKYLITVAMINAGLGTAAGLVFWAWGMPNPALWGALAFTLNFIPYIGALTEMTIVGIVAAMTFPNLGHALLVPASFLALAITEGSLVSPYVMGRRMTLNPVIIFAAVTFWGFLWGFVGIFLAVPTLVMFKIFCDHIEPLAPIGEFLGS